MLTGWRLVNRDAFGLKFGQISEGKHFQRQRLYWMEIESIEKHFDWLHATPSIHAFVRKAQFDSLAHLVIDRVLVDHREESPVESFMADGLGPDGLLKRAPMHQVAN